MATGRQKLHMPTRWFATTALIVSAYLASTAMTIDIASAQTPPLQGAGQQGLTSSQGADLSLIAALLIAAVVMMGLLSTIAARLAVRGRRWGLTKS